MATSPNVMPTDQNSTENTNDESLRNANQVDGSGEIRTEPPQKVRGRKPRSKPCIPKEKKQAMRGMGVARLEKLRIEEEHKNMVLAQGGGGTFVACPNATLSPDSSVVLQGFPSTFLRGGLGSGQFPFFPPWRFVEASTHEPSLITNHCDTKGSMEELGSGNPRNGTSDLKEYDFFPVNPGNKSVSSVATSVDDCSPETSTIDLSLKL